MSKILIEVTEAERDLGTEVAKGLRMRSATALAKHAFLEFTRVYAPQMRPFKKPAKRGTTLRKGSQI